LTLADPEEEEDKKIVRSKRGQDPDWDVILNSSMSTPLVIVDAYNIIHQWPRLKKWMNKGQLWKARDKLVQDCEDLRSVKGWRIEVVFDGAGRSTTGPLGDQPGASVKDMNDIHTDQYNESGNVPIPKNLGTARDQASKASVTDHGVRVVYSGVGNSADAYIEARCAAARKITDGKITGSLIVASNDNMVRVAGQSAGAFCMSADHFVNELRALRMAVKYRVEAAVAKANGHEARPAKLMGQMHPNLFRNNQFIVEDKRKNVNGNKHQTRKDGEANSPLANGNTNNGTSHLQDSNTPDNMTNGKANSNKQREDGTSSRELGNKDKETLKKEEITHATAKIPSWAMVPKSS
jgi:predicted RNA-binding protein with PIN domain